MIPFLTLVSLIFHVQYKVLNPITNKTEIDIATCSAVYISPTEALTAEHCISTTTGNMWVKDSNGHSWKAIVEKKDVLKDLAIIKIKAPKHFFVKLGKDIKKGQHVFLMSDGYDMPFTYGEGVVENIVPDDETKVLQIIHSCAILPGASGSGLFDDKGRLVGINTATYNKSVSIAVDISEIKQFLNS